MKRAHKMTKFVAYLRVSTARQGKSGLGVEAQRDSIANYVASVGGKIVAEFSEVESGTHNDRPKLAAALAACRLHGGATLIVAKLDRLARNVAFVSRFLESGCEFVAADLPQANRMLLQMMSVIAEYEAKLISQRTTAALAAAKRRGKVLGGDRGNILDVQRKGSRAGNAVRSAVAAQRAADLQPVIADLRNEGAVTLAQIAAGLNQRGISTARGGEWSAVQVARVVEHAEA
jgi:DNA invertase Pin-like site-specific DNA recombinase